LASDTSQLLAAKDARTFEIEIRLIPHSDDAKQTAWRHFDSRGSFMIDPILPVASRILFERVFLLSWLNPHSALPVTHHYLKRLHNQPVVLTLTNS
jgi:hypothetical protein